MIKYVLKMWSNNVALFADAVRLREQGVIDGVELYNNASVPLDWTALAGLKSAHVITIHHPHSHGWHDYWMMPEQKEHWAQTQKLADFFQSQHIIVHPARTHSITVFLEQASQMQDARVIIENMAGLDIDRQLMECGQTLSDLVKIKKVFPICFDLEKAVKAATQQGILYQSFITEGIKQLEPMYFHISGGDAHDAMDQHLNIWDGSIDMRWVKEIVTHWSQDHDVWLAFETPKEKELENDAKNMAFFKEL